MVRTALDAAFRARLVFGLAVAGPDDESVWSWEAVGIHPDCWTDGICWACNVNEEPSDQPVAWMPFTPLPSPPSGED